MWEETGGRHHQRDPQDYRVRAERRYSPSQAQAGQLRVFTVAKVSVSLSTMENTKALPHTNNVTPSTPTLGSSTDSETPLGQSDLSWVVISVTYVALAPRHPSPVITGSTVSG